MVALQRVRVFHLDDQPRPIFVLCVHVASRTFEDRRLLPTANVCLHRPAWVAGEAQRQLLHHVVVSLARGPRCGSQDMDSSDNASYDEPELEEITEHI